MNEPKLYKYVGRYKFNLVKLTPKFLYRHAGYEKIQKALKCKDESNEAEITESFSEIFYLRTRDGKREEYVSVYSHNPLENENRTTSNERAKLVFPVFPTEYNLSPNSGLVELPIVEICRDVNCYGKLILTYHEDVHPHYGLYYDEYNKSDVDMILLSINELSSLCYPYKNLKIS